MIVHNKFNKILINMLTYLKQCWLLIYAGMFLTYLKHIRPWITALQSSGWMFDTTRQSVAVQRDGASRLVKKYPL